MKSEIVKPSTPTAKHTALPWTVFEEKDHSGIQIGPPYTDEYLKGHVRGVCSIRSTSGHPWKMSAEQKANAGLIVTAVNAHHDLVAALEKCMFALGRGGANVVGGPNRAEWESARLALSKAAGERI